jgi:hypothetical protein
MRDEDDYDGPHVAGGSAALLHKALRDLGMCEDDIERVVDYAERLLTRAARAGR